MCDSRLTSIWQNPGPDKGWSWVIAFGLWVTGFPAYGIFGTLGVIYPAVKETLQISQEEASWPFFLSSVTANLVGILLPVVTRIMSIRELLASSLILFTFGGLVCFLAPRSILILSIFYGVPYGIFHGFFMHSSFIVVSQYFDKLRASALAFLITAPAIAMFTLPLLIQYLLTVYEYRGALLLVAAFAAQSLPAIMLLRPRNQNQFPQNSPNLIPVQTKQRRVNKIVIAKMDRTLREDDVKVVIKDSEVNNGENMKSTDLEGINEASKMLDEPRVEIEGGDVNGKNKIQDKMQINAKTEDGDKVKLSSLKNDIIRTLKKPQCVLVVLPDAFIMTKYIFCYILMVEHAAQCGISRYVTSLGYLAFGISALIFRLGFAAVIDRNFMRKDVLLQGSFYASLANCLLYTFWNTPKTYIVSAVLFSFSISSYQSLRLSHMTNHFEPKDVPILFSFSSIFSSSISLVTPKLIGLSISLTGDYKPLWVLACFLLAVAIMCLTIECCFFRKKRRGRTN